MAKKTSNKRLPDWASIVFWVVGIIAVIGILTGIIIFTVRSIRDVGDTISGETTTTETTIDTQETFPDFTGEDPGIAVGAVEIIHIPMENIIWAKTEGRLVATPPVANQIGNTRMRLGNDIFFNMVEPGEYPELNLLKSVCNQYDYIDENGLGRSFTYSGMYAWNCQDNFLVCGSEEDLGKRYLVILDDGSAFTVLVDRVDDKEDSSVKVKNIRYVYEIDDGYVPEEYPNTDGLGNIS